MAELTKNDTDALKVLEDEIDRPKVDVGGRIVDGVTVPIDHVVDRWCEVHLTDGTIVQIKHTVFSVVRAVNEWDPQGNPIYAFNMQAQMNIVKAPKELRIPVLGMQTPAPMIAPPPLAPLKAGLNVKN